MLFYESVLGWSSRQKHVSAGFLIVVSTSLSTHWETIATADPTDTWSLCLRIKLRYWMMSPSSAFVHCCCFALVVDESWSSGGGAAAATAAAATSSHETVSKCAPTFRETGELLRRRGRRRRKKQPSRRKVTRNLLLYRKIIIRSTRNYFCVKDIFDQKLCLRAKVRCISNTQSFWIEFLRHKKEHFRHVRSAADPPSERPTTTTTTTADKAISGAPKKRFRVFFISDDGAQVTIVALDQVLWSAKGPSSCRLRCCSCGRAVDSGLGPTVTTAFLAKTPALADVEERIRMQPTATASIPPPADMDLQAMQSMDWLFKKERIYLLAQFWQQVSLLLLFFFFLISVAPDQDPKDPNVFSQNDEIEARAVSHKFWA